MRKEAFSLFLIFSALVSCTNHYYSKDDFGSVLKIDSHVHINSDDGTFEAQALKDNFLLLTLNVDHSDSAAISKQYNYAVHSAAKNQGRVFFGPTFLFDTAGWGSEAWSNRVISQLRSELAEGAVTVKIWKNIGMTVRDRNGKFIMVDDPGLDKVIAYIKSRGLPVTGHLGEPRNCWLPLDRMTVKGDSSYFAENPQYHMFLHPDYPSYEDQIKARDNFLKRNPDLIFIGCHLGSLEWNVDSLASRLDRFPNMAVDMSARICHLQYQTVSDREKVRNFCIKYQNRLLYGTDAGYDGGNPGNFSSYVHETWLEDWKYFTSDQELSSGSFIGKFRGLRLPREVVRKIYHDNAKKWYKLPTK